MANLRNTVLVLGVYRPELENAIFATKNAMKLVDPSLESYCVGVFRNFRKYISRPYVSTF